MFKKIVFGLIFILVISCVKDYEESNESLPLITTVGKNTFGCNINDIIFVPKYRQGAYFFSSNESLTTHYYYESFTAYEGYTLQINAYNDFTKKGVNILFQKGMSPLEEGALYQFQMYSDTPNNLSASFSWVSDPNTQNYSGDYYTQQNNGELKISKLDTESKIISGTFWFDVIDYYGNIVEINNGRFDLIYKDEY